MNPTLKRATMIWGLLIVLSACSTRPAALAQTPIALRATAIAATAPTTAPTTPAAVAMKETLTYLSSDELEGRGINTAGIDQAAAFIAGNFHGAGLKPLPGMTDYFQRFDWATIEGMGPDNTLALRDKPLTLNKDYTVLSLSADKIFDAPAVFVGYGITSVEQKYDDYAGIDVKGKVAVAWRFEPADKDGKSRFGKGDWSDLAHLDTKAKNAAEHGAVALVLFNPPMLKAPDTLLPFSKQLQGSMATIPVFHVRRAVEQALLQQAPSETPEMLQQKIDGGLAPQSFALTAAFSGKVVIKRTVHQLKNVVGYLPGYGSHADEYVIVGAHYDHLGRGGVGSLAPKSKDIHNGADDNGSGTTAVVELAREFARADQARDVKPGVDVFGLRNNPPPLTDLIELLNLTPRSIIFVAFTAEEEGLIGSSHFVNHPPIPLDHVVAMLNLDMVGRLRQETLFVGGAGTAPSFDAMLETADKGLPLVLKDIGKGGLGPSDHMSFATHKIPVMFFFTGLHEDYHRPTDKIEKINFNGMAEIVELSSRVIRAMAVMPREQYVTAADAHSMSMGMGSAGGGSRVTLGVVPSYGEDEGIKGVKITGTSAGSPAEAAGLKEGDIIVGFNDKAMDTLVDLSTALAAAKPGDKVKLRVIRNKTEIVLDATLAERK